jgi:hypothetical protein
MLVPGGTPTGGAGGGGRWGSGSHAVDQAQPAMPPKRLAQRLSVIRLGW